jgi:5-enolpyruvylshikimate-3-phosphate synthase
MSLAVAALLAEGETVIANPQAVDISFPSFWQEMERLSR